MGSCLKTQLKAEVNNDNLYYFKKIAFNINNAESFKVFSVDAACTVELDSGVNLYKNATLVGTGPIKIDITSGDYYATGTGRILLSNYGLVTKFGLNYRNNAQTKGALIGVLEMPLVELDIICATPTNELINVTKTAGEKTTLNVLRLSNVNMQSFGDLKEFARIYDVKAFSIADCNQFKGLTDLAYFPSLEKVTLLNCRFGGTIEDLVAAFVATNRTSGSCELYKKGVTITFEGTGLNSQKWYTISWNGVDNITVTEES